MVKTKAKGKGLPLRAWYCAALVRYEGSPISALAYFCAPPIGETKPDGWVFAVGKN